MFRGVLGRGLANVIVNRDRGEPHDSPPPTPPGIRITYHGGSVEMIF